MPVIDRSERRGPVPGGRWQSSQPGGYACQFETSRRFLRGMGRAVVAVGVLNAGNGKSDI